jgi:hypothetical protein
MSDFKSRISNSSISKSRIMYPPAMPVGSFPVNVRVGLELRPRRFGLTGETSRQSSRDREAVLQHGRGPAVAVSLHGQVHQFARRLGSAPVGSSCGR